MAQSKRKMPEAIPFGPARLAASFDEALDGPMAAMPAKIVCDVTAFQKRRHYDDDVCLVAVEAVSAVEVVPRPPPEACASVSG